MLAIPTRFRHILLDFLLMLLFVRSSISKRSRADSLPFVSEIEFDVAFPNIWYNRALHFVYAFSQEQHYSFYTLTSLTLGLSDLFAKLNLSWTPIASLPHIVSFFSGWLLAFAVVGLVISIASKLISRSVIEPKILKLQEYMLTEEIGLPNPDVETYWKCNDEKRHYFYARSRLNQITKQVSEALATLRSEGTAYDQLCRQIQRLYMRQPNPQSSSNTISPSVTLLSNNRFISRLSQTVNMMDTFLATLSEPRSQRYHIVHDQLCRAIAQYREQVSLDTPEKSDLAVIESGYAVMNAFNRYIMMRNTTEITDDLPLGKPSDLFTDVQQKIQAISNRVNEPSFAPLNPDHPTYPAVGYLKSVVSVLCHYYHSSLPASAANEDAPLRIQALPTYSLEILSYIARILDEDKQILRELGARLRDQPPLSIDQLEDSIVSSWRILRSVANTIPTTEARPSPVLSRRD